MAKAKKETNIPVVSSFTHGHDTRSNNPQIGLVNADSDKEEGKQGYSYDPHIDPELQWSGKAERTSFEVDTVSLHVHERIQPQTILEAVKKPNIRPQPNLFDHAFEPLPLREEVEFYRHEKGWANRLIAGDSLLVMNSLLQKENMAGRVQTLYFDPPYGIKYGSNFQPFVNKRDVKDGNDDDLTSEPEMIKAFRDTWELGIHSYLSYLRDRLLLARELLHESGSVFVQISDENVHRVRCIMDEVFGAENFCSQIYYRTTGGFATTGLSRIGDYILWYAKNSQKTKYRQLFTDKTSLDTGDNAYRFVELLDKIRRAMTPDERNGKVELPKGAKIFRYDNMTSQDPSKEPQPFEFEGKVYEPKAGSHWKANYPDGMNRLKELRRIGLVGSTLSYIRYIDDYPVEPITNNWDDTGVAGFASDKVYVVQTNQKVIERCLLMTTDPGDLVLDITCGSGTTAVVAEQWGRRWITCDTSRVATTLAKQRLMTAKFDCYPLRYPEEGLKGGFVYKTVPHITLKSLANDLPADEEILYDQPKVDKKKVRVTGPFTVEAVPFATVLSLDETVPPSADTAIARSGHTARVSEWKDELIRSGVRGKAGQRIEFADLELLPSMRYIHASGYDKHTGERIVVSFGPEFAPLEQRQVEIAIGEAQKLAPKPKMILFCAFSFDPEAAKDIDETDWPGVTLLRTQMNADLLTHDLKKKSKNTDSFWLMGQPDVELRREGEKYVVEVRGFDYFDTKKGEIVSGGKSDIAMWLLDTDYDGRSLFARQVFFPMSGANDGWSRLAKNLKGYVDEELIEAYRGTVSIPFEAGEYGRVAVKIIDARGIESLKIIELGGAK